ncbi:MAG: glycosyltransferase [Magnetococcales bacterium]|nr:glycosyltransferase [Magnetococcales bacterium]
MIHTNPRLRILHVVPTYIPAWRYGGPIRSVHGLCRSLVRQGHEVHVFTSSMDGPGELDVPLGQSVNLDGVMVRYDRPGWPRRLNRYPGLLVALREQLATFDLVHLHGVFLWSTWATARLAERAGVPYVVSPRGMLVRELIRRRSRLAKTLWIRLIEQRTLARAAFLHLTAIREQEDLDQLNLSTAAVRIIPNGIDPPDPATMGEPFILPKAVTEAENGFILFLGRVNWKKGLDRLIKALPTVPKAILVIAGNDEEGYRHHLERLIAELHLVGRVFFVGTVGDQQKWGLLQQARVLALTSYSENFGNVILEAMQMGCPVVVTEEVGLAHTVTDLACGVVTPGDPGAIAHWLRYILDHPEQGRIWGQNGQHAAREHFSWDTVGASMVAHYRSVLAKQGSMDQP